MQENSSPIACRTFLVDFFLPNFRGDKQFIFNKGSFSNGCLCSDDVAVAQLNISITKKGSQDRPDALRGTFKVFGPGFVQLFHLLLHFPALSLVSSDQICRFAGKEKDCSKRDQRDSKFDRLCFLSVQRIRLPKKLGAGGKLHHPRINPKVLSCLQVLQTIHDALY